MRILYAGHFDPCGVGLRQRRYLRALGVDFRIAVERVYWQEGLEADWWLDSPRGCDTKALQDFASTTDLIIDCPAIHQHWSYDPGGPPRWKAQDAFPVPLEGKRRATLFHGSVNLAENITGYREIYADTPRLATTLDYAFSLGAAYVPSIVETTQMPAAPLRESGLTVVHAPSDVRVCDSEWFFAACRELGVEFVKVMGQTHEKCLAAKARHHAGYDHLRGAFSVNSLENAGLGLLNLVAVSEQARAWLHKEWGLELPWPVLGGRDDLVRTLRDVKGDIEMTRGYQLQARQWSQDHWDPLQVAERILAVYERIAKA